jgi:hypothetical protein
MKVKIGITLLIIAPAVMFALELLDPWPQTVPQALVGTWEGEAERFVQRWYTGGTYPVSFYLREDGTVDGTVGDASFHNAQFRRNRGWIGRILNLASDYIVKGDLEGLLKREIQCGKVDIYLNFDKSGLRGSVECSECGEGDRGDMWITARNLTFDRAEWP